MSDLYRRALAAAGYGAYREYDGAELEEAVRECFVDYVDAGAWADLTLDDLDDITLAEMAKAIIRFR